MDFQTILNIGVAVGVPAIGWLGGKLAGLDKRLTEFQIKVAEQYVTHTDLAEIKELLKRIDERMERKADKA